MVRSMPATDGPCWPGRPFPPALRDLIFRSVDFIAGEFLPPTIVTLLGRVLTNF
jgi:hypothetical protein